MMTPRDAERAVAEHGMAAARALLERQARGSLLQPAGPPFAPRPQFDDPQRDGFAVWAWAGVDGRPASDRIERADFSDRNFVKRWMWEACGRRTDEWTIWPFSGHGFLAPLTVYATSDQFADMVHAAQEFARVGGLPPVAVGAARSLGGFAFWLIGIGAMPLPRPERHPLAHDDARQDLALLRRLKARVSG
jgi:hypothetical protein